MFKTYYVDLKEVKIPKVIALPEIYPHLYLSNFEYANQPADILQTNINYIINLSGHQLTNNIPSISIAFVDSRSDSYDYFISTIDLIIQKILWCINNQLHVLVNCSAGSERSVSSVIAFAIRYTDKKSTDYWLQYIENCKIKSGYLYWSSLKNETFLQDLLMLQNSLVDWLSNI